jgi:hypothetical protein
MQRGLFAYEMLELPLFLFQDKLIIMLMKKFSFSTPSSAYCLSASLIALCVHYWFAVEL